MSFSTERKIIVVSGFHEEYDKAESYLFIYLLRTAATGSMQGGDASAYITPVLHHFTTASLSCLGYYTQLRCGEKKKTWKGPFVQSTM